MEKTSKRSSNFELLRIISMVFIIWHHYTLHGGILNVEYTNINKYLAEIIYIFGKIGVNLFILISGYFLINSNFKIKKIVKLIMKVLFYNILVFFVLLIFKKDITLLVIKKTFFPISYSSYWFITAYVGMYFFSPFINKLIKVLKQDKFKILLIISLILFSIIPTLAQTSSFMGNLQWFIFVYMIGAYIRLYDIKISKKNLKYYIIFLYLFLVIGSLCITYFSIEEPKRFEKIKTLVSMNFLPTFCLSIFIFIFFKNLNIKEIKIINYLGKSSLAVYLLHDNEFIRYAFWKKLFKVEAFYNANIFILLLHILLATIITYALGTVIEFFRVKCIENQLFKIKKLDSLFEKIDRKMQIE